MISIIIPTLNEEKNLERCLRSILDQTYKDLEIFVVDGGSKDTTLEIARKNGIKIVEVSKRRPHDVSTAKNEGAKVAKGDILVFLDADAVLSRNFIELLDKYFQEPDVIGVSCSALPLEGNSLENFLYSCNNLLRRISNRVGRHELSYFSCLGYRREPFFKVDGFREDLYACEDIDLALRLRKFGRFVFAKEAVCFASPRRIREWSYPGYLAKYLKFLIQYHLFDKIFDYYDDLF